MTLRERPRRCAVAVAALCLALPGSPNGGSGPLIRSLLLSTPAWHVQWSPPDESKVYVAVVRFRDEGGALLAASAHPDGSRCYPDIRVHVQEAGFLFHGCTGVPKEMRHDPADAAAPFKGRAFGFSYRWLPAEPALSR